MSFIEGNDIVKNILPVNEIIFQKIFSCIFNKTEMKLLF